MSTRGTRPEKPDPYLVLLSGSSTNDSFPSEFEVAIVKVAKHDDNTDPYVELATEMGLQVSTSPRTKPACCDGTPPVDGALVRRLHDHFDSLSRAQQKEVSRRRRTSVLRDAGR